MAHNYAGDFQPIKISISYSNDTVFAMISTHRSIPRVPLFKQRS